MNPYRTFRLVYIVVFMLLLTVIPTSSASAGALTGSTKVLIKVWKGSGKAVRKCRNIFKVFSNSNRAQQAVQGALSARTVMGALSDRMIAKLSRLSVPEAARILGAMKLSSEALVDTYLRILVHQGKISPEYAAELWDNLKNVPGFIATMKKATSMNGAQQIGHLFEINLANSAKNAGFTVRSIGEKFKDIAKKGLTDLDLVIEKSGKRYLIEAKAYADVSWESLASFRADMDSLKAYGKGARIFIIKNKPSDPNIVKALEKAAAKRGVRLLFGDAVDVISQIDHL